MMEEMKSRVYILVDEDNRVTRVEGEYTLPEDLTGWILYKEGAPCDELNLGQTHLLPKSIMTDDGIYRYKYTSGKIVERLESEIQAEIDAIPILPTDDERRDAQILFTALMTDTLLED